MLKFINSKPILSLILCSIFTTACQDTEKLRLEQLEELKSKQQAIIQAEHNIKIENLKEQNTLQADYLSLAKDLAKMPKENSLARLVADSSANIITIDSSLKQNTSNIVVENASMMISIREYDIARQKVHNSVAQYEAIVISEKEEFQEYKVSNTFHIQVPVKHFSTLIESFREMAMVLREKSSWKEDLSVNWADVHARLESKQTAVQKLQELLKKANNANEILPIQKELESLQEEMQVLNRTAQTLQQKTLYSSIILTIYQDLNTQPIQVASFSEKVTENALQGWAHFKNTVINLATYWVYISIGFVMLLIMFLARKKADYNNKLEENSNNWKN